MDWEAIKKPLIIISKIINNEEVVFDEDDEIIIPPNQSQWEWASIFEEFRNVNE